MVVTLMRITTRKEVANLIEPSWQVLDVGSGDNPFEKATVLVDRGPGVREVDGLTFRENPGAVITASGRALVRGDLEALPFQDASFDFVYAAHVLEHVREPSKAIRELVRVAPRGYVEVPRSWFEFVDASPFHCWLIDFQGGELVFRPKTELEAQFGLGRRLFEHNRPLFLELYEGAFTGAESLDPLGEGIVKSLCHICLYWEGEIHFRILPPSEYLQCPADVELSRQIRGPVPVSVIVHTKNEEKNIVDCLESCIGWANEVVVRDMQSTDMTRSLARKLGARVDPVPLEAEFDRARNDSAVLAENDWILYLDADERLTPEIRQTIERCIGTASDSVAAFQLPFRVVSFGSWIQHAGGWWPNYKSPPLLRKGRFRFPGQVHLPAQITSQIVRVSPRSPEDAILHFSHPNLEAYFEKLNRYTSLEARKLDTSAREPSWEEAANRLGGATRWYFDDTEGHRDGLAGFLLSLGSGIYEAVSEMKFLESRSEARVPPSAEAFFARAREAARTEIPKGNDPVPVPAWVRLLRSWVGGKAQLDQPVPVLSSFDDMDSIHKAGQSDPASQFILVRDQTGRAAQEVRERLRETLEAEAHQLEIADDRSRWWFWWKDGLKEVRMRLESITHRGALGVMGGGEVQIFQTVKALRKHGVVSDVGVGCLPEGAFELCHVYSLHHTGVLKQLMASGCPYVLSPIYWDRTELMWIAPRIVALFSTAQAKEEIDAGFSALKSQRDLGSAKQQCESDLPQEVQDLVRRASLLLPNANSEYQCLVRAIPGLSPEKAIIPNAVQDNRPEAMTEERGDLNLPKEFVLCVGRIEPNKNQLTLLYALRDLDLPVVLIGHAPDPSYANLCREVGGEKVLLLGPQPQDVVSYAMRKASVHCLPSFGETPGLANMEAAACGCPIVVSNRGAESEYFGGLAWYCDPLDPDSISSAVLEAISARSSTRVSRLSRRMRKEFTWHSVAENLSDVFRRILA